MNLLITICARGGSKGIPGKNTREINGKPLIAYTIDSAREFAAKYKADLALSTDSREIIEVAARFGLETDYVRPEFLASDTAGKIDTLGDVLLYTEKQRNKSYDYILDLDVTAPLRTQEDLQNGFETLQANEEAYNLFSVNPANRSPYFNMVEQEEDGFYKVCKKPSGNVLTRQSAPKVYDMNASFYFYRRKFFEMGLKSSTTDKSLVYVMPHMCFDLDHPVDFEFLSFLLENNKLDFQF